MNTIFLILFFIISIQLCLGTTPTNNRYSSNTSEEYSSEEDDDEDDSFSSLIPFIKIAVEQLRNDPNVLKKLQNTVADLIKEYPPEKYPDSFIPALLKSASIFLELGKYVNPTKFVKVSNKMLKHYNKEPDSVFNNVAKIGNKVLKGAGAGIEESGDIFSSTVRTVKDLHSNISNVSNNVTSNIPLLGTMVWGVNAATHLGLETLHVTSKYGTQHVATTLKDKGEANKQRMKKRKLINQEISRQAKEAKKQ